MMGIDETLEGIGALMRYREAYPFFVYVFNRDEIKLFDSERNFPSLELNFYIDVLCSKGIIAPPKGQPPQRGRYESYTVTTFGKVLMNEFLRRVEANR